MSFYTDVIKKNPKFESLEVNKDVSLLEPGTRAAVARMIVLAHEAGHELRIGETFRSQPLQTLDFIRRKTKLRIVGCHHYGVACDLQLWVKGKYDPRGEDYRFLEKLCRQVGLISGADWGDQESRHTFHDWDHVQRVPVWRQSALFAGNWYPPIDYDPYKDQIGRNPLAA